MPADRRHVDDVGFLVALAGKLQNDYNIGPGHVFVTGMSNGGFMSNRLACDRRDVFAAIAPVAGTLGVGVACNPSRTLWADDRLIGEGELPQTVTLAFTSYAGMDIGRDNGLVVDRAYEDKAPYGFTGTVKEVVFDLKPVHLDAEKALHEHASVQAVGQGAAG